MQSNDFEAAFSSFIARQKYDNAEALYFSIVRAAFLAGWKAGCSSNQSLVTPDSKSK